MKSFEKRNFSTKPVEKDKKTHTLLPIPKVDKKSFEKRTYSTKPLTPLNIDKGLTAAIKKPRNFDKRNFSTKTATPLTVRNKNNLDLD